MKQTNKSLEYVCIFGGGAIRGVSYVGTLKALEKLGINPNIIAGSSVGAVLSGLLAVGYNADEIKEIFMDVNFELFKDIHFGFASGFALSKGGIFLEWIRELIEKKYYGEHYEKGKNPPVKFSDLDKNFVVITTDLTNFKYKEFSKFETPDFEIAYAIRISSTMPGLMKPAEIDNILLVDGDLQKSWPLWRLSKNLCPDEGRILEFRLEGEYEGKGKSALNFMNTIYSCITSLATDFIMDTYADRDKFDYIKINTGSVIVVDFNIPEEKREELMNIGYQQTIDYFNLILPEKKKELIKFYQKIEKQLKRIQGYLSLNRIRKANEELGTLYMNINPTKRFIDIKFFNEIEEFKKLFLSNILPISLLGQKLLKNSNIVKEKLNKIINIFDERILELENYILNL
jgi:NTE family protein